MSKRKSPSAQDRFPRKSPAEDTPPTAVPHSRLPSAAAIRETIESLAIAIVLAFLFRTFEAEAFVIPTGSMAPTLMGRHKDLDCPKCGYPYQVGASEEVDQNENRKPQEEGETIISCTCPMCRYTADIDPSNPPHDSYPSYRGDRILVDKLAYDFFEPKRWDVVVFKYPNEAQKNYIKRLVGLPGETIRIQNGDIWTQSPEDRKQNLPGFSIARKKPEKLLAMLQPVFDNDYMPMIAKCGWTEPRWKNAGAGADAPGAWQSENYTTFTIDGKGPGEQWLRYHHLTPSYHQWELLEKHLAGAVPPTLEPRLITDFTAYDTNRPLKRGPIPGLEQLGLYWVGDLALECSVDVQSDAGSLAFELRKGGRKFLCRIDVATGKATLSVSGNDMKKWQPTAQTAVKGKGLYDIRFSNCDDELLLWVDGRVVAFDSPTKYDDLDNTHHDENDFIPVGVASEGVQAKISHLRILRDLYYIAQKFTSYQSPNDPIWQHPEQQSVDFTLKEDQFFMLGDNSINSMDGRLWGRDGRRDEGYYEGYWVSRDLLIGKAFFIYWPHSWDRTPYVDIPFPFFPNVSRMGLIR